MLRCPCGDWQVPLGCLGCLWGVQGTLRVLGVPQSMHGVSVGCLWGVVGVSRIHVGCWRCPPDPCPVLQAGVPGGVPAGVATDAATGDGRVRALQREVQGVTTIMTQNVERILARGENLEQLHSKSQDLEATVRGARGPHMGHGVTRVGTGSQGWAQSSLRGPKAPKVARCL